MSNADQNAAKGFDPKRRRALQDMARHAVGAAAIGASIVAVARQSKALPAETLRPPGALAEAEFSAACVRCGLCVRACPYKTLKLAEIGDGPAIGTPYFIARDIPCEMCEDIPCVKACPTGALAKSLTVIDKARMGTAAIVSRETCLNLLGLRCDVCYRVCPVIDKAITLERTHNARTDKHAVFEPVVHADACTGCGKCEKSCVLEVAAIKVLPLAIATGRIGEHYKLGWEEKKKAGRELVPDIIKLPTRAPEVTK
ncbi:MAG: ferredoxin-type protein NapG [Hyphomicrobiaceae bacterium]|nr:MAG: ferredoxin-type protein NapG [Hyphomicrobiaceae bacterium]